MPKSAITLRAASDNGSDLERPMNDNRLAFSTPLLTALISLTACPPQGEGTSGTGSSSSEATTTTGPMSTTGSTSSGTTDDTSSGTSGTGSESTTVADLCAGVVCMALDQCHAAGECDSKTGVCSDPPLPDGSACDDANSCTADSCQAGVCSGVPDKGSLDQSVLTSAGFSYLSATQKLSQTLTVGATGVLTGVEIAGVGCVPVAPMSQIKLDVLDDDANVLAEGLTPIEGLPDCAGYPLEAEVIGKSFFDLTSSCAAVTAGEVLTLQLDLVDVPPGVCDMQASKCTSGVVGSSCGADFECGYRIGAGIDDSDPYPSGNLLYNGMPDMTGDLQFKTFIR